MAIKKIRMRPPGYSDIIYPETSADVVVETIDKKIMTADERTKINLINTLSSGTNYQYLKGDGTWGTPPNDDTTYSIISESEIDAGNATTARSLTGARVGYLKNNIIKIGGTQPANGWWFEEI